MSGLGREQQRAAVARVEHEVVDDRAQEMRSVDLPGLARGVAAIDESAFARSDEK
jgi:hypothetical protein